MSANADRRTRRGPAPRSRRVGISASRHRRRRSARRAEERRPAEGESEIRGAVRSATKGRHDVGSTAHRIPLPRPSSNGQKDEQWGNHGGAECGARPTTPALTAVGGPRSCGRGAPPPPFALTKMFCCGTVSDLLDRYIGCKDESNLSEPRTSDVSYCLTDDPFPNSGCERRPRNSVSREEAVLAWERGFQKNKPPEVSLWRFALPLSFRPLRLDVPHRAVTSAC